MQAAQQQGKEMHHVGVYGLQLRSPALFPEEAEGYKEAKSPSPKLVKKAMDVQAKEIKAQKAAGHLSGAYWAEHGRLPTGLTSDPANEPIYLLQKSAWMQDPATKEFQVIFGDRYDTDSLASIPAGLSAHGDTFAQADLGSEELSLIEKICGEIHEERRDVRDARGCSSKDNCCGLPTYFFFLPVICCLGGFCYDQYAQKQVVNRVQAITDEHIADVNGKVLGPKGLALVAVESTYHTLQYIGKNVIKSSTSDMNNDETYTNSMVWKWELAPITLRWLELGRIDNTAPLVFTPPTRIVPSLFGSADPKTPHQSPQFKDILPVAELKQASQSMTFFKDCFV